MSTTTPDTCKRCGCTEKNCQLCVDRTGAPCRWTDATRTFCTACARECVICRQPFTQEQEQAGELRRHLRAHQTRNRRNPETSFNFLLMSVALIGANATQDSIGRARREPQPERPDKENHKP